MEPLITYLKRSLREAGAANWPAIVEAINQELPDDRRIGLSLLRKVAYGDRENPGVNTVQPLLDYFAAVKRGEKTLPDVKAASRECPPSPVETTP
jgi:hypothetical protein